MTQKQIKRVPSPSDFDVIKEYLNNINEKLLADQKVVFHFSAGVERAGTLSTLMILLKAYKPHIGDDSLNSITQLYYKNYKKLQKFIDYQFWVQCVD